MEKRGILLDKQIMLSPNKAQQGEIQPLRAVLGTLMSSPKSFHFLGHFTVIAKFILLIAKLEGKAVMWTGFPSSFA